MATVKVEALKWHTHAGEEYNVGDTYAVDEQLVDSLAAQGMAVRSDRVEVAKKATAQAAKQAKSGGTAVAPMTTGSTTGHALAPAKAPRAQRKSGAKTAKSGK